MACCRTAAGRSSDFQQSSIVRFCQEFDTFEAELIGPARRARMTGRFDFLVQTGQCPEASSQSAPIEKTFFMQEFFFSSSPSSSEKHSIVRRSLTEKGHFSISHKYDSFFSIFFGSKQGMFKTF